MNELVYEILATIKKNWQDELKAKFGESPSINTGDFILEIIKHNSGKDTQKSLNISARTFDRMIKKLFPKIKLQGGRLTWSHYILSLIEHKKCLKCSKIYKSDMFNKGRSDCKYCRVSYQNRYYLKRKDIWEDYYKTHKGEYLERNTRRKRAIYNATPKWADLILIKDFYNNCPKGYHVDHIIPLQGVNVCGLHVINNLQYLPAKENLKKGNKFNA